MCNFPFITSRVDCTLVQMMPFTLHFEGWQILKWYDRRSIFSALFCACRCRSFAHFLHFHLHYFEASVARNNYLLQYVSPRFIRIYSSSYLIMWHMSIFISFEAPITLFCSPGQHLLYCGLWNCFWWWSLYITRVFLFDTDLRKRLQLYAIGRKIWCQTSLSETRFPVAHDISCYLRNHCLNTVLVNECI